MSKPIKKNSNEVFTIEFDQVNDSSEIPGIAELLGSKVSSKKDSKQGIKSNTPPTSSGIKSLKEFGTKLEIHFMLNDEHYCYLQHEDHSSRKFFGLDELLKGTKVSMFFVQEFGVFGEFKQSEKPSLFDAFGITDEQYLQFVLNQSNKILTIYASEHSMLSKKEDVITFTEVKNNNLSPQKIELDLAS